MNRTLLTLLLLLSAVSARAHLLDEMETESSVRPPAPESQDPNAPSDRSEELVPNPLKVVLTREQRDYIRAVNQKRKENGKKPLAPATTLMGAAQELASDMRSKNYFLHRNHPNSLLTNKELPGNPTKARAENIAAGNRTPEATVEQLFNSAGHRANMLSDAYSYIGVGHARRVSQESTYSDYWAENYAAEP